MIWVLGLGDTTGQPQYSTKIAPLASSAHQALNVGTLVLLFLATDLLIDAIMDSFPGLLPLAKGANPLQLAGANHDSCCICGVNQRSVCGECLWAICPSCKPEKGAHKVHRFW